MARWNPSAHRRHLGRAGQVIRGRRCTSLLHEQEGSARSPSLAAAGNFFCRLRNVRVDVTLCRPSRSPGLPSGRKAPSGPGARPSRAALPAEGRGLLALYLPLPPNRLGPLQPPEELFTGQGKGREGSGRWGGGKDG